MVTARTTRDGAELGEMSALLACLRQTRLRLTDDVADAGAIVRSLLPRLTGVPLPAEGQTAARWAVLAEAGAGDLSVARLFEGHLDAVAILAEAGVDAPSDALLGVWAAEPSGGRVEAHLGSTGWELHGVKRFCSGVEVADAALITAHAPDGYR